MSLFIGNQRPGGYFHWQLIAIFCLFVFSSPSLANQPLSLYIDTSEGGDDSKRRLDKLKQYLNLNQCPVQKIITKNKSAATSKAALIFSPLQIPFSKQYQKLLNIDVINNDPLAASILVRGSTDIKDIRNLEGVRIAFLSANSVTGYQLQQNIFKQAGIIHSKENITFTQSNVAAVTLLLHKDVFAAAIASPLANRWAQANDLIIVTTSKTVKPGGLWVDQGVSGKIVDSCGKAFLQISHAGQKNKKLMLIFPAWLHNFSI